MSAQGNKSFKQNYNIWWRKCVKSVDKKSWHVVAVVLKQ